MLKNSHIEQLTDVKFKSTFFSNVFIFNQMRFKNKSADNVICTLFFNVLLLF